MSIKPDKFDVGDIVIQERIEIDENTKSIHLYRELSELSAKLLMKCLNDLDYYLARTIAQDHSKATKAFKIKPNENRIIWNEMDLRHVYKLFRAFDGFLSIYTEWIDGTEMKLSQMIDLKSMLEIQDELNDEFGLTNQNDLDNLKPGTIRYSKHKQMICIKCKDKWAGFLEICLKGHHLISSKQFNNGYLSRISKDKPIVLDHQ